MGNSDKIIKQDIKKHLFGVVKILTLCKVRYIISKWRPKNVDISTLKTKIKSLKFSWIKRFHNSNYHAWK